MVGVAIARGLFNFGQSYWAEAASQGVAYKLRGQVFRKIETLSFSYHDQAQTSQLLTRITSDIEQIRAFVGTWLLQVVSAIATILTGRTSFVIAHRLSTVTQADQVLVIQQGHIVENGTHQQLIDKDGIYAKLYALQLGTQS